MRREPVRVLLVPPASRLPRLAVDWLGERRDGARVILPSSTLPYRESLGRLRHEPFEPAPEPQDGLARQAGALLAGAAAPWAVEGVALALWLDAAVVAAGTDVFRALVPLSAWTTNVAAPLTDTVLARCLGLCGRMPAAFRETADEPLQAALSLDVSRLDRLARRRRQAARKDGPERFRPLGRSAGLRPAVAILDLVAASRAGGAPFAAWLGGLDPAAARALFSHAGAAFL